MEPQSAICFCRALRRLASLGFAERHLVSGGRCAFLRANAEEASEALQMAFTFIKNRSQVILRKQFCLSEISTC